MVDWVSIARSSNGRTHGSEPCNRGSNPCWAALSVVYFIRNGVGEMSKKTMCSPGGSGGAVYGMGMVGALVYYLQNATTFSEGVMGLIKAIVWPGVAVYKLFGYFGL